MVNTKESRLPKQSRSNAYMHVQTLWQNTQGLHRSMPGGVSLLREKWRHKPPSQTQNLFLIDNYSQMENSFFQIELQWEYKSFRRACLIHNREWLKQNKCSIFEVLVSKFFAFFFKYFPILNIFPCLYVSCAL